MVICALCVFFSTGHPDNIMTDVRRQMRQCEVMLKSAVAFTNSLLRYARALIYSRPLSLLRAMLNDYDGDS